MHYFILKSLHILSVVLFLGNIITGVFWKFHGDRVGTVSARAQALDGIIRSDRWFTLPGVVAIIVTGVWLAMTLHLPLLGTTWILWSLILFGISGICLPVLRRAAAEKTAGQCARAGVAGNWNQRPIPAAVARLGALGCRRDARAAGGAGAHGDEAGVS